MKILGLSGSRPTLGLVPNLNKSISLLAVLLLFVALFLNSCNSDEIGDNYYTFTGEMMGEYLKARPEKYSEFTRMLDTTDVLGLLNAYGHYTCFAPNNDAMRAFYVSKGKTGLADFSIDSLKKVVYDHVINGHEIPSNQFGEGFLHSLTMSGRNIKIDYSSDENGMVIVVNETSKLQTYDNQVENGYVHELDKTLMPSDYSLVEAIHKDANLSLFYDALIATGLDVELAKVKDPSYTVPNDYLKYDRVPQDQMPEPATAGGTLMRVPLERKYGFTVLVESNATLAEHGINNIDQMKAYAKLVYDNVYPEDADITDISNRKNSFNRFVAYHLINKKIGKTRFIDDFDNTDRWNRKSHSVKTYDMFEYIETMCPNTLLEVRTNRFTNESNLFNMISSTGQAIRFTSNTDKDAINGVYHEIDGVLAYTKEWEREISGKKLRLDAASFFPELANNDIRVGVAYKADYPTNPLYESERWFIPPGYIDRMTASESTLFCYYNADARFMDYQGDEVFMKGMYDFSMTTPAIPAGTYEIRFGYQPTGGRGVAQLYWDRQPCGIPLDLRLDATNAKIGYQTPGSNSEDPYGYENDKMMRNRGYMKGPADYTVVKPSNEGGYYSGASARMSDRVVRRILGIYTFDEAGSHVFSVKAALSGQFMFDYLEFVPVELLESEGIN